MLIADFQKEIGFVTKYRFNPSTKDTEIESQYNIYYSPNALFAVCDDEKNLVLFAADIEHLKNMLGLSKEFKDNMLKNYHFTFHLFTWNLKKFSKDEYKRLKHIILEIHKLVCCKTYGSKKQSTQFCFLYA